MSLLFAALAAISFGAADYAGGRATRYSGVVGVMAVSQFVGLAGVVLAAVLITPAAPGQRTLIFGAAAGLSGAVGLGFLYTGLSRGAAAVVSPTAALVGTLAPIVAGIFVGENPSLTGWTGISLSIPAILLLSVERNARASNDANSLVFGLVAGLGFGGFYILIDQTPVDSGLWPLVAARSASLLAVVILLSASGLRRQSFAKRSWGSAILAGALDMLANVFFLLANQIGLLVISAVVSSLYPAPTVLLSRLLDRQRLGRRRIAGLLLALLGVAFMAI